MAQGNLSNDSYYSVPPTALKYRYRLRIRHNPIPILVYTPGLQFCRRNFKRISLIFYLSNIPSQALEKFCGCPCSQRPWNSQALRTLHQIHCLPAILRREPRGQKLQEFSIHHRVSYILLPLFPLYGSFSVTGSPETQSHPPNFVTNHYIRTRSPCFFLHHTACHHIDHRQYL